MNTDIKAVFATRDDAVRKQDMALFLSTQLYEIGFGSSAGYLSVKDMTTEVLSVYEEPDDSAVVFVRETYKPQGKQARSAFLMYFLIAARKGWKIHRFAK
jgi:hypothetical protein